MNGVQIFLTGIRTALCTFSSLLVILLAVVLSVLLSVREESLDTRYLVVAVNEDEGALGEEFLSLMEKETAFRIERADTEDAVQMFRKGQTPCVFFVHSDFSEKLEEGSYEELAGFWNSQDSPGASAVAETVINNCLRLWAEMVIEKDLVEIASLSEAEQADFRRAAEEIFKKEATVRLEGHLLEGQKELRSEDGKSGSPAAWYGVLSFFYLLIGATFLIRSRNTGLFVRAEQRGFSVAALAILKGLPGVLIALLGAVPVILLSGGNIAALLLAFLCYLLSGLGLSFLLGAMAGSLQSLIFLAVIVAGSFSLLAGLVVPLPEWTAALDPVRCILPGTFLLNAIEGRTAYPGGVVLAAMWLLIGTLCLFLRKRRNV